MSQISCFLAVANHQSFSKAAQELYISQPAVSKQVSMLEQEIGTPLFDRSRRAAQLTQPGQLFYNLFSSYSEQLQQTMEKVQALNTTRQGEVHIGCTIYWDITTLYDQIQKFFAEKYPNIRLIWDGYTSDDLIPALKSGKADVIFTLSFLVQDHPELITRNLGAVPSILLYSARHPAVMETEHPTLSCFRDVPFFLPYDRANSALRNSVVSQCRRAGFTPKLVHNTDFSSVLLQIQCCAGVMVTDGLMMSRTNPLFGFLPMDYSSTMSIAYLQDNTNLAKNLFVSDLMFYFKQFFASGEFLEPKK